MKKSERILKKMIMECILISSILVTANASNSRANELRRQTTTMEITEYAPLHNEVEKINKLEIAEDGSLNIVPYTYIHKEAPSGYEIDYVNDTAYKTRTIEGNTELADKIQKYTVIRNDLLSMAGIMFTSLLVFKPDYETNKFKKMILK